MPCLSNSAVSPDSSRCEIPMSLTMLRSKVLCTALEAVHQAHRPHPRTHFRMEVCQMANIFGRLLAYLKQRAAGDCYLGGAGNVRH